nr:hypothetical protein [Tanacetum cinerariifolium]
MIDQDKIMVAAGGPGHPNIVYYSDSDESDEDEPSEVLSPSPTFRGDSDPLVEETDTLLSHFNDSSPSYETFCFDIEEKSSGSTTSHSYHSFPEYELFYFDVDHIEEKSNDSSTSHSDLSLPKYETFHFDLLIDPLYPADKSDSHHEELSHPVNGGNTGMQRYRSSHKIQDHTLYNLQ